MGAVTAVYILVEARRDCDDTVFGSTFIRTFLRLVTLLILTNS